MDPITNNLPFFGLIYIAAVGLFAGKLIGPLDRSGYEGLRTFKVDPYG